MTKRKAARGHAVREGVVELIDVASPGRLVFAKSKPAFADNKPGYELEIATRGTTTTCLNRTP